MGFIKDYDGGTLMECAIYAALPYLGLPAMVAAQRAALDRRIRALSNAHVVHPGLPPGRARSPSATFQVGLRSPTGPCRLQPHVVSGLGGTMYFSALLDLQTMCQPWFQDACLAKHILLRQR